MSNTGIRNLYKNSNGYFIYRRPDTRKRFSIGKDRRQAEQAARELNEKLMNSSALTAKVIGEKQDGTTFAQHAAHVDEKIWQPRLRLGDGQKEAMSRKTYIGYTGLIRTLNKEFGELPLNDTTFDVNRLSRFLEQQTPNMAMVYRRVLSILFNKAMSRGYMKTNPALMTEKSVLVVSRKRLTFDLFTAIRKEAEPWVQRAMDLAIHLGIRAGDVSALRWENIVTEKNETYLLIRPQKGRHNKKAVGLKMRLEEPLLSILSSCRDNAASPYILHFPHRDGSQEKFTGKALSEQYLSRQFKKARLRVFKTRPDLFMTPDESDSLGKKLRPMTAGEYPSWHEIRSLAGWLVERAKQDGGKSTQKFLGHEDLSTTEIYLSRRPIEWIEVNVGSHVP